MKRIFLSVLFAAFAVVLAAQAPQAINYQAVARNTAGAPITNTTIGVQFRILQGSSSGTLTYTETYTTNTNSLGLFNLAIGRGTVQVGVFANIPWVNSPYFLEVSIDPAGGANYTVVGTSEMLSVPYALYAERGNKASLICDDDGDTWVKAETSNPAVPYPVDADEIHMSLGLSPGSLPGNVGPTVLVLRHNGRASGVPLNLNPNLMLELIDPTGGGNTFIGKNAGERNQTGINPVGFGNTAIGKDALKENKTGHSNTATGADALLSNTTGVQNTANGVNALANNIDGNANTANGVNALLSNTKGAENTAVGADALRNNTGTGSYNAAFGKGALSSNIAGNYNTANGTGALASNTTNSNGSGGDNTAVGAYSLEGNTTGSRNTAIGFRAGVDETNTGGPLNNASAIGANAKVRTSNSMILGDVNVNVGIGPLANTAVQFPLGPQNKLEIDAFPTLNASGLSFRQLPYGATASAALPLSLTTPPKVLSVDAMGKVILVEITGAGGGGNEWRYLGDNIAGIIPLPLLGTTSPDPLTFIVDNDFSGIIHKDGPTFFGYEAGLGNSTNQTNTTNTGFGFNALKNNGAGTNNTATGYQSLLNNTGSANTAIGTNALGSNTIGVNNTAIGSEALKGTNMTSNNNTAVGVWALHVNMTGYDNCATGTFALENNKTGFQNTATGHGALNTNVDGARNTANGTHALRLNTANENTATGAYALELNKTGTQNTASGVGALQNNITGGYNTANGNFALQNNNGDENTATGAFALQANTTGSANTAVGHSALKMNAADNNTATGISALEKNVAGTANTANGAFALQSNLGDGNTAVGYNALNMNNTGITNTAVGIATLTNNKTGDRNTATGAAALNFNSDGNDNSAFGKDALLVNNSGDWNTALGKSALEHNFNGNGNTAVGMVALTNNQGGSDNTAIGYNAGPGIGLFNLMNTTAVGSGAIVKADNSTAIGAGAIVNTINTIVLGNNIVRDVLPGFNCTSVLNGVSLGNTNWKWREVWACNGVIQSSDSRLKTKISKIDYGLNEVMSMRPVQYFWKEHSDEKRMLGFIAQEMETIVPESVIAPKNEDEYYAMKYDALIPVLTKAIQEQQAQIEALKLQNAQLSTLAQQSQFLQTQLDALRADMQSFRAALEKQLIPNDNNR